MSARRRTSTRPPRQHSHVAEVRPDSGRSTDKRVSAESFSAFLGRVLDQLSLSAWLPAAMLVGSLAVLLQMHGRSDRNVAEAVTELTDKPLGVLVLVVFALVLATVVTQAFEFEVIRVLEGYWGNGPVAGLISRLFVYRQRRRLERMLRRRDALTLRAFRGARLLERQLVPAEKRYIVDLIEAELEGRPSSGRRSWCARRRMREALSFDWRQFAPAELMRRLDAVEIQIEEYPRAHRLLPTRLGNTLRAVEDALVLDSSDELEAFIIRRWEVMPGALRQEHDQYRTRLDMYCMLVFIFALLAIVAPVLITKGASYAIATSVTSAAFLVMSAVSYTAAVASARGYGTALKAIAEHDQSINARR